MDSGILVSKNGGSELFDWVAPSIIRKCSDHPVGAGRLETERPAKLTVSLFQPAVKSHSNIKGIALTLPIRGHGGPRYRCMLYVSYSLIFSPQFYYRTMQIGARNCTLTIAVPLN